MPRFRLHAVHRDDLEDVEDSYAEQDQPTRRRDRPTITAPRLIVEGRSGRALVEVDGQESTAPEDEFAGSFVGPARDPAGRGQPGRVPPSSPESPLSSYDVAAKGPEPTPDWLITSLSARDTRLGTLKSGKEAEVSLLDRSLPQGPGCILAVKTYRDAAHRMFHRDAGYQEGRRVRRSREGRAMAARTKFGRELISGKWAAAEFSALCSLWSAGARVPYPVQIIGSELMMEFIGGPDGTAAPRLAAHDASTADFIELWHDLVATLEVLAEEGLTHGDLSPYNVLVDGDHCVLIDLPQVVDVVANPQGQGFLDRDCANIADFFARRGVRAADGELLALHLGGIASR